MVMGGAWHRDDVRDVSRLGQGNMGACSRGEPPCALVVREAVSECGLRPLVGSGR